MVHLLKNRTNPTVSTPTANPTITVSCGRSCRSCKRSAHSSAGSSILAGLSLPPLAAPFELAPPPLLVGEPSLSLLPSSDVDGFLPLVAIVGENNISKADPDKERAPSSARATDVDVDFRRPVGESNSTPSCGAVPTACAGVLEAVAPRSAGRARGTTSFGFIACARLKKAIAIRSFTGTPSPTPNKNQRGINVRCVLEEGHR
jgi:hypothetical protein